MRLAITVGIIAMLLSPLARAAEEADENKILALENAWNQAQLHHNSTVVASMLPDTFIYTDYDGTVMNKTQFLADLKDTSYQATMVVNENVKVFTYEGAAVVVGTYHTKGKYKGQPIRTLGQVHRYLGLREEALAMRRQPHYASQEIARNSRKQYNPDMGGLDLIQPSPGTQEPDHSRRFIVVAIAVVVGLVL